MNLKQQIKQRDLLTRAYYDEWSVTRAKFVKDCQDTLCRSPKVTITLFLLTSALFIFPSTRRIMKPLVSKLVWNNKLSKALFARII